MVQTLQKIVDELSLRLRKSQWLAAMPVGSYTTPFFRVSTFLYITDPKRKTRYPKKGVGYKPLGGSKGIVETTVKPPIRAHLSKLHVLPQKLGESRLVAGRLRDCVASYIPFVRVDGCLDLTGVQSL